MSKSDRTGHFPERLVKQGFVALPVAARIVHRRAYPQQYAIVEPLLSQRQLDALAHVISSMVAVYTVNYRSARFRELAAAEIEGGAFRDGAVQIVFGDGREPIRYLAARVDSASLVARKLREFTPEHPDAELIRIDRSPPTPTR